MERGQKAVEKVLANMRELAEMAIKSQTDAAVIIGKRFEVGPEGASEPLTTFQRGVFGVRC